MGLFGKKKTASAIVGLYGKHPSADDFLRQSAGSAIVRALDEWLSNALAAAARLIPGWEDVYPEAAPVSFLFTAPDPKASALLLGTLAPSTDRIGRQYPLILFAELEHELLARDFAWAPVCRFQEELAAFHRRRHGLGREALLDAVRWLTPPDPEDLAEARRGHEDYLERTTCGEALGQIFGAEADAGEAALRGFQHVCRSVSPGSSLGYGVRCPAGSLQVVALWLHLLQTLTRGRMLPNAIWTDDVLLLYFGKLPGKALTALWHAGWQDDSVYDLATARDRGGPPLPREQSLRALLASLS